MKNFIEDVKLVESSIGKNKKVISPRLKKVRNVFLNSIVISKDITKGELISLILHLRNLV